MKLAIFLTLMFLGQSFAVAPIVHEKLFTLKPFEAKQYERPNADYRLCGTCIQFAQEFIQNLLNIILSELHMAIRPKQVVLRDSTDAGVIGGCADLCNMLPANNVEKEVCDLLCAIVGIKEFIKIIEEADLDPIYYCELLKACEIKDDGDATITNLTVTPTQVVKGSTFEISFTFVTKNGTGTGELVLEIHTQDGLPLSQATLMKPIPAGQSVNGGAKVKAEPDPNCDPTQGPCEMWLPGNYSVVVAVCNGQCGSKHPHSQVYDTKITAFNVVEN